MSTGVAAVVEAYNSDLLDELHALQWDDHRLAPHERCEDHLADAYLYAWRHCHQYWRDEVVPEAPLRGSAQWWADQEEEIEAEQQRQMQREMDRDWWDPEHSTRTPWWEKDA